MRTNNKDIINKRILFIKEVSDCRAAKISMYKRYTDVAQAIYTDPNKEEIIRSNKETFELLANRTVYVWALNISKSDSIFNDAASKSYELRELFKSMANIKAGAAKINEILGISNKEISFETFIQGLLAFKMEKADLKKNKMNWQNGNNHEIIETIEDAPDEELMRAAEDGTLGVREVFNIIINRREKSAFSKADNSGKKTKIDTGQTECFSKLNSDNSINCTRANISEFIEKILLSTPVGAGIYINKIWKSILDTIINEGYKPEKVKRVCIYGGQMYVNKKIINLDGVLGGIEKIRLRDIVNFRLLFKRFYNIFELNIDNTDMLRAAIAELGDNPIEQLFNISKNLQVVYVQSENGNIVPHTRQSVNNYIAVKTLERAKFENDVDLYCANQRKKTWNMSSATDNIWGVKLAKASMDRAGQAFLDKNKPKLGRVILYTGAGLIAGTVGTIAWGLSNGIRGLFNLGNSFRK